MSEMVEWLAAARKIVQWGIAEARERDAMHEEAASIGIERDLDDAEIDALAEKIERTLTAFLAWFAERTPQTTVSADRLTLAREAADAANPPDDDAWCVLMLRSLGIEVQS